METILTYNIKVTCDVKANYIKYIKQQINSKQLTYIYNNQLIYIYTYIYIYIYMYIYIYRHMPLVFGIPICRFCFSSEIRPMYLDSHCRGIPFADSPLHWVGVNGHRTSSENIVDGYGQYKIIVPWYLNIFKHLIVGLILSLLLLLATDPGQ